MLGDLVVDAIVVSGRERLCLEKKKKDRCPKERIKGKKVCLRSNGEFRL